LPYIIDGDIKVTNSNACFRYLGRKADLLGKTEKEQALCDVSADVVKDLRDQLAGLYYGASSPTNFRNQAEQAEFQKKFLAETLPQQLKIFSEFLGNKKWLAGDSLTFPDFHFYELLDQLKIIFPGTVEKHSNLVEYIRHFEELPRIAAYLSSNRFKKGPINQKFAYLGNTD